MISRIFIFGLAFCLAQVATPSMPSAAEPTPSQTIKAADVAIFDMTEVGGKLCAVGERGMILHSADNGKTWQGASAPTSRTLVAVAFADEIHGFAVGHGGTILRTEDGGASWQKIAVADAGQDAVLGVLPLSDGRVIAYGAFGMYLESADMGKTWTRRQILGEEFERHISKIIEVDPSRMLLVAESGTIALSDDHGATWTLVPSPYEGSYFGALKLRDDALLIFGMRGNIYRSSDRGQTWTRVPFAAKTAFNGGSLGPEGRVVLAGNSGLMAVSPDNGKSFSAVITPETRPLAQARYISTEDIVYVGFLSNGRMHLTASK